MHIDRHTLDTLKRLAVGAFPYECCGILIGRRMPGGDCTERIVPAVNIAEHDRRRHYQIDWKTLLRTVRTTRGGCDRIVGFYHSHPDGPARPSARDAESAWIDYAYLIFAVEEGRCTGVTCWRVPHDGVGFEPEPLV